MRVREAKDFLVQQTTQQAAIEGVSLSDLEKRMMYFTESEDAVEDPIRLNQEFEAKFDTDEYELKISGLLHRAYERIKDENPAILLEWDEAVRELRKGDHYILVLWDPKSPSEHPPRPPHDSLKLLGTALLVTVITLLLIFGYVAFGDRYGFHGNSGPKTHTSVPLWIQRLLLAGIVGVYLYYVVVPSSQRSLFLESASSSSVFFESGARIRSKNDAVTSRQHRGRYQRAQWRYHLRLRSFSNSDSVNTGTPNSFALSYFDPGSVPTTT
jgi:hypothetical protein